MKNKVHNFSAGPSILPHIVFEQASSAINNFNNSGLSILEISHRSKDFIEVLEEARSISLDLASLNKDDYSCLFLQGGASMQFLMVAYNFLNSKAGYVNTGSWSTKAIKEAKMFGDVSEIASSADKNFNYIPNLSNINDDFDYVHITSNNTIFGTQFHSFPETASPLFADMSSDIFSRNINFSKFDLIYAGAQKNLGPAGVTMVLIKNQLLDMIKRDVPSMLSYKVHIDKDSSFNTPPVFSIFSVLMNLRHIKSEGLVKGTIQVPTDGKPIILLSDHGTLGGYPKLGVVISADYDKLVQIPPGSKVKFKEIELKDAENLYKLYNMETNNMLNKII